MKILVTAALVLSLSAAQPSPPVTIPASSGTALDGRAIALPRDLTAPANILILGFTHDSPSATTIWEKSVRSSLATTPAIGYLDIAFLEDAPSFVRPVILHSLKKFVPDIVKPFFLTLTVQEAAWKQIAGFSTQDPNAAYVLLIDRSGHIRWQTHQPFSPESFQKLTAATRRLADEK